MKSRHTHTLYSGDHRTGEVKVYSSYSDELLLDIVMDSEGPAWSKKVTAINNAIRRAEKIARADTLKEVSRHVDMMGNEDE